MTEDATLGIRQHAPVDGKHLILLTLERPGETKIEAKATIEFALTPQEQEDLRWYLEDYLKIAESVEQVRVEFYERFRTLCRALGLVRGESQTEREFLVAVDNAIRPQLIDAGLERMPGDLVDSFYEVRFGGRRIDVELERRVDSQLSALERLASASRTKT